LREKVALYRHQQIYEDRRFDESIREHREILEALHRRDPDAAETRMKRHLDRQCRALINLYAPDDKGKGSNRPKRSDGNSANQKTRR
jgi:DNA-binding GntR family transcriptional regulator